MQSHFSFCSLPARQAIKNPPRRLTGVMVRSPAGSTSPGGDYSLGDLSQPAGDDASPGVRILLWVGGKAQLGTWGSASITEKGPGEKPCLALQTPSAVVWLMTVLLEIHVLFPVCDDPVPGSKAL